MRCYKVSQYTKRRYALDTGKVRHERNRTAGIVIIEED